MTALKNPVTGHGLEADKDSLEFWKAAGYREESSQSATKKAPAKKSAPAKSSK